MTKFRRIDPYAILEKMAEERQKAEADALLHLVDGTGILGGGKGTAVLCSDCSGVAGGGLEKSIGEIHTQIPQAGVQKIKTAGCYTATTATKYSFTYLEQECPEGVEDDRWYRFVADGRRFLASWGSQARAFGWTDRDLFGLHDVPKDAHHSYDRLARYDALGLVWVLNGNVVVALTPDTAKIRHRGGSITTFRKSIAAQ